jgi:peptidoglycan/LPS O-acetylase OafA/YrhL
VDVDGALLQAGESRSARIEALRAVAALGVLAFHVLIFCDARGTTDLVRHAGFGGAFGVFLFFALTGYLLFTPFARATLGGRAVDLRRYARNRVLPLYYFVLLVLLLAREHGGDLTQWWRFATFTESFFSDTVNTVNGPMWSLAVEVQFYVLLPLIALAVVHLGRGTRAGAVAVVAVLGLLSVAVWWATVHEPAHPDPRWRYSLPATFFEFTPGMLIALLRIALERRPTPAQLPSDVLLLAALVTWLFAAYHPRESSLIVALSSFLVLAGGRAAAARRPARVAARRARARGDRARLVQLLPVAVPDR